MTSTDRYLSALRGRRQVSSAVLEDALSAINLHFKHQGINIPSGKTKVTQVVLYIQANSVDFLVFGLYLQKMKRYFLNGKGYHTYSLNLSRVTLNTRVLSLLTI